MKPDPLKPSVALLSKLGSIACSIVAAGIMVATCPYWRGHPLPLRYEPLAWLLCIGAGYLWK